jgi:AcrR family transcriptional regulator
MPAEPTAQRRDELLDRVVEHLATHGLHDASLRTLAAAVGTSHRMLSYYFGSHRGLLREVSAAVEARQRASLEEMSVDPGLSPVEIMRAQYARLVDPALHRYERLFFELYGRALQGDPDALPLLEGDVDRWVDASVPLFEALGYSGPAARAEARLSLAVARGLLSTSWPPATRTGSMRRSRRTWPASPDQPSAVSSSSNSASCRVPREPSRFVTVSPTMVIPRRSISGIAASSSDRAAVATDAASAVGCGSVDERVARE